MSGVIEKGSSAHADKCSPIQIIKFSKIITAAGGGPQNCKITNAF
jgi:hypothetical protein